MASVSQSLASAFHADELARIQKRDPMYLHEKIQELKVRASHRASVNRSASEWYFKIDSLVSSCQGGVGWLVPMAGFLVTLGVEASNVAYIMSGMSFIVASLKSFREWTLLRSKAEEYKRVGKSFHSIATEAADIIYQNLSWDDLVSVNKRLSRDYDRAVEAAESVLQKQEQGREQGPHQEALAPVERKSTGVGVLGGLQLAALPHGVAHVAQGVPAAHLQGQVSHIPTPTPLFQFPARELVSPLDVFVEPNKPKHLTDVGMATPAPASKRSSSSGTAAATATPATPVAMDPTMKGPEV